MAAALPTLRNGDGLFAELAEIAQGFLSRIRPPVGMPQPQAVRAAPQRLSLSDQWVKVVSVLSNAIQGADAAKTLQSAATQQLDLAQYGLTTLVDELSAVMNVQGRRVRGATVHVFGAGYGTADDVQLASGQALAA